ncbi:hypothetical protein RJ640_003615 [Escallonia rubra]|uniref:Uncharacterized protein n=1 Tax=Escallonia rubra TaxID=112253 RepID=A0AA88QV49_9ASTE|nr:hypothetical protein RJ640_003615 [Escallonia rubra]
MVPIVVVPLWIDQTTNAKFVQDVWKVGVRVRVDENGLVGREVKTIVYVFFLQMDHCTAVSSFLFWY